MPTIRVVPRGYTQRPIEEGPWDAFSGGGAEAGPWDSFSGQAQVPLELPPEAQVSQQQIEPGSIPRREAIGPWNFFTGPENEKQPS